MKKTADSSDLTYDNLAKGIESYKENGERYKKLHRMKPLSNKPDFRLEDIQIDVRYDRLTYEEVEKKVGEWIASGRPAFYKLSSR